MPDFDDSTFRIVVLSNRLRGILANEPGYGRYAGGVAREIRRFRAVARQFRPRWQMRFWVIPIRQRGLPTGGLDIREPYEMVAALESDLTRIREINRARGNRNTAAKSVSEILYLVQEALQSLGEKFEAREGQAELVSDKTKMPRNTEAVMTDPATEADDKQPTYLEQNGAKLAPKPVDTRQATVSSPEGATKDSTPSDAAVDKARPSESEVAHGPTPNSATSDCARPQIEDAATQADSPPKVIADRSKPSKHSDPQPRAREQEHHSLAPPPVADSGVLAPQTALFLTDSKFERVVSDKLGHYRHPDRQSQDSSWIDALCLDDLEALPITSRGPRLTRGKSLARGELVRTFHLDRQPRRIYLIGDIHGDLLALESCIECIRNDSIQRESENPSSEQPSGRQNLPTVVLLGDLIDDGPESLLVLRRVLDWAHETRLILIPGNHDLAIKRNKTDEPAYRAEVNPCEFTDELNDPDSLITAPDRRLVDNFIDYCEQAPAALVLPDNSLAVHGGVPHVDLHEDLRTWFRAEPDTRPELSSMIAERVREDFAWGRIHPKLKKKIPDRSVRGQEMGVEDVKKSLELLGELLGGKPPIRIVRGHDHLENRWDVPKKHEGRVITINAMSYRQGREHLGPPTRKPIVARWEDGGPGQEGDIELLQIDLAESFVEAHAPELQARREARERELEAESPKDHWPQPESSSEVDS